MRRLTLALILLTVTVAAFTTAFLPERCEVCNVRLYRMSILESFWHGHGEHLTCLNCFTQEHPEFIPKSPESRAKIARSLEPIELQALTLGDLQVLLKTVSAEVRRRQTEELQADEGRSPAAAKSAGPG